MSSNQKTITILVRGGLGNQLFCYAFGRSYELKYNRACRLDTHSGYTNDQFGRVFRLRDFALKNNFEEGILVKKFWQKLSKFLPLKYRKFVNEKHLGEADILGVKFNSDNVYLKGYWQSERYFKAIKEMLLEEFQPSVSLSLKDRELLGRINDSNSIFIHVRRLEYPHQLPLSYYDEAMKYFNKIYKEPRYFIFGDDLSWIKSQTIFKTNCEIVEFDNNKSELIDFLLMKSCQHGIIANSSFSWWAAWLNNDQNQIIICPENSGFDLAMAEDWVKLKVKY